MGRATLRLLLLFLLVNCAVFTLYRAAFLVLFASDVGVGEALRVLVYGLRLDLGLIGLESTLFGAASLLALGVRLRLLRGLAAFLTLLNALAVVADLRFFAERNQHMGELLMTNILDPDHLGVELRSFVTTTPIAAAAVLAGLAGAVWLSVRLVRRAPARTWPLLPPVRGFLLFFPAVLLLALLSLQPVTTKSGWGLRMAHATHYSRLGRIRLHQAIANPLQEILVVHLPLSFVDEPPPRLPEAEALALCSEILRLPGGDPDFPLLREIEGRADLGIENVIVVQVEGLTGSLLDHREDGHPVTPFLRELAGRGISFPNTLHSYPNTAGGVFAAVTGMTRTTLGQEQQRIFTRVEGRTPYSSLARCLDVADAWFFAGYRQSHYHYEAFAGNQGFTSVTWPELHAVLVERGEAESGETVTGLFDGVFFQIALDRILAGGRPFAAHLVTTSTHYPWRVPDGFETPIRGNRYRTIRYLDESVRKLVDRLAEDPGLFRKTLLVVTADHTNMVLTEDPMELLRIPLIFFSPAIEAAGLSGRRETMACQADILPSVLGLVAGRHRYAGTGRNLFDPDLPDGVITASRNAALYFKGEHAFRRQLLPESESLLRYVDGKLGTEDVARDRPEVLDRLRREYHALYETAERLSRENRVFPAE